MARGAKIKLGNGKSVTPTPEDTETMVQETQEAFGSQSDYEDQNGGTALTSDNGGDTAPPANGNGAEEEIDEDLKQPKAAKNLTEEDKRREYATRIRKLGRSFAAAATSKWELGEILLEGTISGVYTVAEYPGGVTVNSAEEVYTLFRGQSKTWTEAEAKGQSFNQNVKKFENIVTLGQAYPNEAQEWYGRVRDIYVDATSKTDVRKSIKHADSGLFEAVVDVIREQLARNTAAKAITPLLTGDLKDGGEILKTMRKKDTPRSVSAIQKLAEMMKAGTLANDGLETKGGKGNFKGLNNDKLTAILQELQDFALNDLPKDQKEEFRAATAKQKRTRRVINKALATGQAGGNGGNTDDAEAADHEDDDQQSAQEQGDLE